MGTELTGGLDQMAGDDGAGERRDERVGALVEGVGLEGGHAVVVGELIAGIGHVGLNGTAVEGALADHLKVLAALADIDGDSDDLSAGGLADPSPMATDVSRPPE